MKLNYKKRYVYYAFAFIVTYLVIVLATCWAKQGNIAFNELVCMILGSMLVGAFAVWSIYDLDTYHKYMSDLDLDVRTLKHLYWLQNQVSDHRYSDEDKKELIALNNCLREYRDIVQSNNPNRIWLENQGMKA